MGREENQKWGGGRLAEGKGQQGRNNVITAGFGPRQSDKVAQAPSWDSITREAGRNSDPMANVTSDTKGPLCRMVIC